MHCHRFARTMRFVLPIVMLVGMLTTPGSYAQEAWRPDRNVEIVVGTAPGSSPDKTARLIQKIWHDQKAFDGTAVVINKPGANNSLGWAYLNQHSGDGHYLMIGVLNLSLGYLTGVTNISYRDITPIALLFNEYTAFVVQADSSIKTARDLIEQLKRDPASASLGVSTAAGGANHLAAALALKGSGIDVKKVRTVVFNSGGASISALLGGHVDLVTVSPSVVIPHLTSGTLRAVAVLAPTRLEGIYGQVPTWRELGVKPVLSKYRSIIGPKGMSTQQVAFWEARLARLAESPEWKKILNQNEWDGRYLNSQQLKELMEELDKQVEDALSELGMIKKR